MICIQCDNSLFEPFSCSSKVKRICQRHCVICSDKDFASKYPFKLKICFARRLEWNAASQYCVNSFPSDDLIGRYIRHAASEIFFLFEKDMQDCRDWVELYLNQRLNDMIKYEA